LVELLASVDRAPGRFLLGIAGPPGAGKSTVAAAVEHAATDMAGAAHDRSKSTSVREGGKRGKPAVSPVKRGSGEAATSVLPEREAGADRQGDRGQDHERP
jgi:adenylate kinase family enzyme